VNLPRHTAPLCVLLLSVNVAPVCAEPPAWAYPFPAKDFKPTPDDGAILHVPGSKAGYTRTQTRDRFNATDWHPGDYPPLPPIVANGRKPTVYACGWCHRADGTGGPENANLAGLPEAYLIRQVADMKSGARRSSVDNRLPVTAMLDAIRDISDEEVRQAAKYFAGIKPRWSVKVVEADTIPKSTVGGWFTMAAPGNEREPIGRRVVEMPEDVEQFESRDPRAKFTAYVPFGSLKRGEELVTTGAGKTLPCATCHGPELKGVDAIPPIVGRWPSYIARQLTDLQTGARAGTIAAAMKPVVEKLDNDDIVAITAFLASRAP
jgi:cytochrome c553